MSQGTNSTNNDEKLTCVADTGVKDLDANLVGFRGGNLDILNRKWLSGSPRNSRLLQISKTSSE